MTHRHVQHTVTVGSCLQSALTLSTSDLTIMTITLTLVGLVVTLIWVWGEA